MIEFKKIKVPDGSGGMKEVAPKIAERAVMDVDGREIQTTYATKDELTDGSVTKVMHGETIGSESKPIYIKEGVPTVATNVPSTRAINRFDHRQVVETGINPSGTSYQAFEVLRSVMTDDSIMSLTQVEMAADGSITYYIRIDNPAATEKSVFIRLNHTAVGALTAQIRRGATYVTFLSCDASNRLTMRGSCNSNDISSTLTTKDFVQKTDPATRQNNLLHTEGNESAAGWKNMTVVTSHTSLARNDSEYYNVIARVTPGSGTYGRFPIMMCTRYLSFNGVGSVAVDGTVTLRGIAIGSYSNMVIGTIADGGHVYLVWKRGTNAGQAGAVYIPAIASSTFVSETMVPADGPTQLIPTEDNPFIPVVWELIE